MTYYYNFKTNSKRFQMYALCVACVAAGAATFLIATPVTGVIATGAGIWAASFILKTIGNIKKSRIVTYTEGFTAYLTNGDTMEFKWEDITHAGHITGGEQNGYLFAYAEAEDRIIRLPPIFFKFDDFALELKEHTPFQEYELKSGETIQAYLKALLVPETEETEDADENAETEDAENAEESAGSSEETAVNSADEGEEEN